MTRPLCVVGFTALFTLFIMNTYPKEEAMGAVFAAALVAFVLSLCFRSSRRDKTLPTAFFTAAVCILLLWSAQTRFAAVQTRMLENKESVVTGTLYDLSYRENGRYYAILHVQEINGEPINGKIRLTGRAPLEIAPRDRVTVTVHTFSLGGDAGNPEITAYYRAEGIHCGAYPVGDAAITKNADTKLSTALLSLRGALYRAVYAAAPNDAGGVIGSLSLGVKTLLSEKSENAFRAAGLSHLLVVSGLHLSTWTMYLFTALGKLRLRRRSRAVFGLLFVAFFAGLTGGAPSVIRAAVMSGSVFAAELFRRESDPLNAVGLAISAMLSANPFAARDLSLLLSVFATVGILLLAKPIEQRLNRPFGARHGVFPKLYRFVVSIVSVTVSVTVFTLPVQLWAFGTLSLAAIPANLLSLTMGSVCMVCGMLGAMLTLLHLPVIGNLFFFAASGCANYLLRVTARIASFDFVLLPVGTNYAKLLLALILIGVAVGLLFREPKERLRRIFAFCVAILFLFCNLMVFAQGERRLQMTVADVGDGTAVVLRCRGETVLLSAGGAYYAESEIYGILSSYGATHLDAVFLPRKEESLLSAALSVGTELPTDTVYYARELHSETIPIGENKIPIDKTTASFADGALLVAVQSAGNYSYAKIQYGDFSAIVSFCGTNDFRGDGASLLICGTDVPKNISPDDFSMIIMNTETPTDADFLSVRSNTVFTTAENGSISLWAEPNGKFQYARRV